MFKRRDIPPVLLLLLLIILVMLTLSQILVVHNGRYNRNIHNMRRLQLELREMDLNLHSLMMKNVPSIELNRKLLQNTINAGRFAAIFAQASSSSSSRNTTTSASRVDPHHINKTRRRDDSFTAVISRRSPNSIRGESGNRSRLPRRGVASVRASISARHATADQINHSPKKKKVPTATLR